MKLYRSASIASGSQPGLQTADVLVSDGVIRAVQDRIEAADGTTVVDCAGQVLLPSLFDMHAHAREPGREDQETIESCSLAAINGGVTGLVLMPDTTPAVDSAAAVQNVLDIAREKSPLWPTLFTAGAITKGRKGAELAGIAGMRGRGAVMLSDAGDPVGNPQVLRRAMEYARQYDLPLASHPEVRELSGKGCVHEGRVSYSLGLPGMPSISEEIGIARDILLAEYVGVRLHIQHVSTARGVETIRRAKERGIRVTCEVTPHHLMLNHDHIGGYDTRHKTNPPLRTPEDNEALLRGLIDGVIDVIATGHSPCTDFEKNQDFASAPFGVTGLETALPALFDRFISRDVFGWDVLVQRFALAPRTLLGLPDAEIRPGAPADFVLFHPRRSTTFTREFMRSRSANTPFLDQTLRGQVTRVIYRGEEVLSR
jgi:dihydroorotase